MGLKMRGNSGKMAALQERYSDLRRMVMRRSGDSVAVLVHAGSFAETGIGPTVEMATSNGRQQIWKSRQEFKERTPASLSHAKKVMLSDTAGRILTDLQPKFEERLRLENSFLSLQQALSGALDNGEKIHRFGSLISGLSLPNGDMDACLLQKGLPVKKTRQLMALAHLRMKQLGFKDVTQIPRATVPIIKFSDPRTDVQGDLSFGSCDGVVNSFLLSAYGELQPLFQDLTLLVKNWAKMRKVAAASEGFLSSYCWTLLVLFYLQYNKVLPRIDVEPALRLLRSDNLKSGQLESFEWLADYFIESAESVQEPDNALAKHVDGFFNFYTRRNILCSGVVSTRSGRLRGYWESDCVKVKNKKGLIRPAYLFVEDPLIESINVSRHVRSETIKPLLAEIRRAHELIRTTGDFEVVCEQHPERKRSRNDRWEVETPVEPPPEFETEEDLQSLAHGREGAVSP